MGQHWCYFLFLLWLSYLIITSVLMFTRGFLLTRTEQLNISTCTTQKLFDTNIFNVNHSQNICLQQQRTRLILILIDALRYDFVTYDSNIENPLPYQNKMPIFSELLEQSPEHSRLYKFLADAPTTTLQRLKGLTTGSLPTFIDIGSNFASHNITEDNIIDQLLRANKKIVFLGDDIWDSIYPNRFHRKYTYPSLNTWDLDTIDFGVYEHLVPELSKTDWDLLLIHLSGVDHVGHRYGPYHHEMERKLSEINNALKSVVNNLDDNMLLYIISDHGSTKTGDHGGNSQIELEAVMFTYSPSSPLISKLFTNYTEIIKQVDLVSTLATVLGVPIPFSNLGTIIFDSIPQINMNINHIDQYIKLLLLNNLKQINNYILQYSLNSDQFNSDKLNKLQLNYNELLETASNDLHKWIDNARKYIVQVRQMCEEIWIQFDSFSMSRGLLLMFLTIFFTYLIVNGIPDERFPHIFQSSFILCSYLIIFMAAVVSAIAYYLQLIINFELTVCFSTGMSSIFMLAILIIQNWELISINWHNLNKHRTWLSICCRLLMLLSVAGLFSNSYIIEESYVLLFLCVTLIWLIIYSIKSLKRQKKIKLIVTGVILSVLIRCTQLYWRCRDEQNNWACLDLLKTATKLQTVASLIALAFFVTVTRIWLRSCGNLVGFSPTICLIRYTPSVAVVCIGGYWLLYDLPIETKSKIISTSWQLNMFVWLVYSIICLGGVVLIWQPLAVYILPQKRQLTVYGRANIIPQLFNHVKNFYNGNDDQQPIVCGLATVYSATFVISSIYIIILIALLLGDVLAPAAVFMYTTIILILIIFAIQHNEFATNIIELFNVSTTNIFCWMLLCQYFFYATGHQPTFTNIHWSAAFIGGYFTHNSIPAILILINTFGAHIIFGITLPLLLIAPFTFNIMLPNLLTNNKIDMKRGELILYERNQLLLTNVFIISCKYILFYGIRMFVCMLVSTIHCRHLMVWSIFAPKLIFEGVGLYITLASVLIGYLLLIRINTQVDQLILKLDKQYR